MAQLHSRTDACASYTWAPTRAASQICAPRYTGAIPAGSVQCSELISELLDNKGQPTAAQKRKLQELGMSEAQTARVRRVGALELPLP